MLHVDHRSVVVCGLTALEVGIRTLSWDLWKDAMNRRDWMKRVLD